MSQQNNNALMQQLKKHFNLVSDPFSVDSHFYFEGAQRQHNLETLRHLASFGDMVLFLTADKGAGKTYLLHKLVASSFEGLNVIYLDCEHLVQASGKHVSPILKACFRSLGIDAVEGSLANLLNVLLTECHRLVAVDGVRTLFTFDNADKIPKRELQEYCSFCKTLPPESALVMLFAGSSSLIQTSKLGSNLDQNIWCHQVQLKPFSQADVLAYLEQALVLAGYSDKFELTELQTQQLVELGKGLPGRINKLFPSVVLEPGLLKIKSKSKPKRGIAWVMAGLAGLLVLSFIFVSYQHGLFDRLVPVFSFEDDQGSADARRQELEASAKVEKELEEKNIQQRSRLAMLDGVLKERGLALPLKDGHQTSLVSEESSDVFNIDAKDSNIGSENSNIEPEKELVEALPIEDQTFQGQATQEELSQKQVTGLDSAAEYSDKSESEATISDKEQTQGKKQDAELVQPKKEHAAFRSKKWLQKKSEAAYLAQILGSYSEETAQSFIQKIGRQEFEIFYLETEHKGRPWFVVFYGVFSAKSHAQNAVKNAPKIIRSQNPWIRSSAEVLASYSK